MADETISALTLFTSYSTTDEVEILDVSDTTFASTGTNKRIQFSTLLSMAGVGSVSGGGTGLTAVGSADKLLGVAHTGGALEYKTLTAGPNVTITPAAGSITIAASGGNVSNGSGVLNITQSAELTNTPVLSFTPFTAGNEPFQIQANSYANISPGTGYNHGMWFGWNASIFAGGTPKPGMPSLYMGFEDNYYDYQGDHTYGVEWYVGYCTPDGTTIAPADLRPFYARVDASNLNTANKNVTITFDIGSGANGVFDVFGSRLNNKILFSVIQTAVLVNEPLLVKTGATHMQEWQNSSGTALAYVNSSGAPTFPQLGVGQNPVPTILSNFTSTAFPSCLQVGQIYTGGQAQAAIISCIGTNSGGQNLGINVTAYGSTISNIAGMFTCGTGGNDYAVYATGRTLLIGNADVVQLNVKANATQTKHLQEWQNSSGTALSFIRPDGSMGLASLADSAAVNNSLYYSTTSSKLCYKDSSGSLHTLA